MVNFTLYSRSYCHLCEDMLTALETFRSEFDFAVAVIDVDQDESLVAQYDELVPVLIGVRDGWSVQLCHYFLDGDQVRMFLTGENSSGQL